MNSGRRRLSTTSGWLILCAALLFSAGRVMAQDVTMALQDLGHGTYRLEGRFKGTASPYDVWRVLTDYENISHFVSSLRMSSVRESTTDRILLEQEALGKKFVFTKRIRVMLQVTEMPYKRVIFEDTLHADFSFYEGSWEIHKTAEGVEVVYRLSCQRKFMVPNALAKDALRQSAEDLLSEVRAEVLRRKQGGCPCAQ